MNAGLMIDVRLELSGLRNSLRELGEHTLPEAQREAVVAAMRAGLTAAIEATPVDTARARSGWVASLQELGGEPPPGWGGRQPSGEAINEGASLGAVTQEHTDTQSEIVVENGVPYLALLEHGTRGQPPRSIIRTGLNAARSAILDDLRRALNL